MAGLLGAALTLVPRSAAAQPEASDSQLPAASAEQGPAEQGDAQPGPAQPGPAQPGPARPGPAQPGPAEQASLSSSAPQAGTTPADAAAGDAEAGSPRPAAVDPDGVGADVRQELASGTSDPSLLEPPMLKEDAFDWLRFDSGEWLGGDLKEMRDGRVTFDSDKMDVFTEDWDDVTEFRSARHYVYVDTKLVSYEGPALITRDTVLVRTREGIKTFPRSALLSIVANSGREIDRWSLKLSLAATARAGNTNSVDFNQYLQVRRQDHLTRSTLESTANLGDFNGARTVQNWNGLLKADVFVHPNFYVTPLFGNGQHNSFQNLLFRGVVGAGVGAHAIDVGWLLWDLETVGAYQYTEYVSAPAGDDVAFSDGVWGLATSVEWDITDDIDLDFDWRSNLVLSEMGRTYHNGSLRFSFEMTDIFDLNLASTLNRIEDPAPDANGVTPKSNDWTFTAGVGIDL